MKAPTIGIRILLLLLCCSSLRAQWSTFAPMPTARWGVGCVEANGKLYVISGNAATNNEVYNPLSNTWTVLAPIPTSTAYPQMASWNGKVYVLGGANGSTWLTSNQIYDIATNTWTTGAPMPSGRMGGTAVAFLGKIYVATGWNGVLLSSLDIYDIASNTWTSGPAAPTARYQTRGGLIGDRMIIAGGYTSTYVTTTESYSVSTNTWLTHAPMPTARYIHAGGSDGGTLYMADGFVGSASNSFQAFTPSSNTWAVLPNAPTARYRVDGAVAGACFYVAGGFTGSATVATLEGYCGLVVLPSADVTLHGEIIGSQARLDWETASTMDATELVLERSHNAVDAFEPIATLSLNGSTSYLDAEMTSGWASYRLTWTDQNGDAHASNVVSVGFSTEPEPFFVFHEGHLQFVPIIPFPLNQGVATLWDASGRKLGEEQVLNHVDWSMEGMARGVYVFRWNGANGQSFTRKVVW
ncbi:MAG: kelch repeat-containing protein [Bacteroidia bacterium]